LPYLKNLDTKGKDLEDTIKGQDNENKKVEKNFRYLIILAAVFVAFAHGANDISNAVGPLSVVIDYTFYKTIKNNTFIPYSAIIGCGIGLVLGLAILGNRVMETIGEKITTLDFIKGYCAQLATAITVLISIQFKIPTSTTSILVGALTGIGIYTKSRGESSGVKMSVIGKIFFGWIATVIMGFIISMLVYILMFKYLTVN